jgi:hypothetical protein
MLTKRLRTGYDIYSIQSEHVVYRTYSRQPINSFLPILKVMCGINSFSSAAEITRAISTWYFAGSYLRFSACYVDENNTIRFSEKFPIDTYNKMSTL